MSLAVCHDWGNAQTKVETLLHMAPDKRVASPIEGKFAHAFDSSWTCASVCLSLNRLQTTTTQFLMAIEECRLAIDVSSETPIWKPNMQASMSLSPSMTQLGTLYNGGSAVYDISDLDPGTLYYIRVSAVSSVGTSDSTLAANNPVAPSQHPDAPAEMAAEAVIAGGVSINSEIEVSERKHGIECKTVLYVVTFQCLGCSAGRDL